MYWANTYVAFETFAEKNPTLVWWKKQGDEFRSAVQERGRSKTGRMARLRGTVEMMTPLNLPPLV